jgi:hypothetical protein
VVITVTFVLLFVFIRRQQDGKSVRPTDGLRHNLCFKSDGWRRQNAGKDVPAATLFIQVMP